MSCRAMDGGLGGILDIAFPTAITLYGCGPNILIGVPWLVTEVSLGVIRRAGALMGKEGADPEMEHETFNRTKVVYPRASDKNFAVAKEVLFSMTPVFGGWIACRRNV
ncbi:MAG: hypothetical protein KDK78_06515 [Chlamydiia bacterium]|nr:hypothetical protein [Chlamydiia bacterium]